jgi:flagellar biosynthesis/type III secretory pathway protein FliH
MKRLFLVPVFGLAALAVSVTAHAQPGGWLDAARASYAADERQGYNDSRRAAYENGFREGARLGERNGRGRSNNSFRNDRAYQRADSGYHRSFGSIDRYRQAFRSGFEAGYADAYRRYGRDDRGRDGRWSGGGYQGQYPRGAAYGPAFQAGRADGYEKGVEDAGKRRSFDVLRHKWYREGDRHYEGRYGSRDQYKDVYREGFKDGYERGYREGRWR